MQFRASVVLLALCVCALLVQTNAQGSTSSSSSYCYTQTCAQTIAAKTIFTKGTNQMAQVFMYINGNNTVPDVKAVFYPRIDDFSALTVNQSGRTYMNNTNIRVSLRFGNLSTTEKAYARNNMFVGYWTAYITLNNGVPYSIAWEEDPTCSYCAGTSQCIDATCAVSYQDVNNDCSTGRCDMVVYLAWLGTDGAGNRMLSANSAFSRMRLFAVTPLYNAASAFALNTLEDLVNRLT